MLKERAQRFAQEIFALYPAVPLRRGSEEGYVKYLGELDEGHVAAVLPDLLRSSPTMPTVAEIRRRIAEVELELPSPIEAYHSLFEPGSERHPLTKYVAEIFGGEYNIRTSEMPGATRSQFLSFFGELRDEAVRRGALPRVVLQAVEKREARAQAAPEQPSVWVTIKGRFEELPEPEREKRLREARKRLLKSGDISPDWLAKPVIEHEALREFAEERGWIESVAS
jgi:hypothetical protein